MVNLLARVVINAAGLWGAARLVSGITLADGFMSILLVAVVFGLVNAVLRPLAVFFTMPAVVLTLGLFILVVNTAMLALTAWLTDALTIDGFWSAFLGAIIISLISWLLSTILIDDSDD